MNGHHKHIAVAVALASAATIGIALRPAAGDAAIDQLVVAESATAAQAEQPQVVLTATDVLDAVLTNPHVLDDAVADVLVRLAGSVCSGTPITGTVYVVTAAHCVLTKTGEVTQRTVVRDHHRYPAVDVLVDTDYFKHPSEALDAAVLVMAEEIPGPSASIGSALPDSGQVTLAGFQPLDSDGTLLRGDQINDHPLPKGATGTQIAIPYGPAGCVEPVSSLEVSATRVMVPCGLVPGASGGGLYAEENGELVLVGILSTVTSDLSANFIVPLAALQKLLDHPDLYGNGFTTSHMHREQARMERS